MMLTYETGHPELAAAYVRGAAMRTGTPALREALLSTPLEALDGAQTEEILRAGEQAQMKLYRFKRHDDLPRVKKVMGFLMGVMPQSLLDIGSGRGVFLNEFLTAFPGVPVCSADILPHRVQALEDIARGGVGQLSAVQENLCTMDHPDGAYDVVTLLEVLEHIPDVEAAVANAVRMARRYVVVTVPSKPDDNPEHIHLLTKERLTQIFAGAGCSRVRFDGVTGHLFAVASVK